MENTKTSQIIDADLYESLIEENSSLRTTLRKVSAVGISMMFHTHQNDCTSFTKDFLKSVVSMTHQIEVQDIKNIYQKAYDTASSPGVLEQFHSAMNK